MAEVQIKDTKAQALPEIKKPSLWDKVGSSFQFGAVGGFLSVLPLVATLFKRGPKYPEFLFHNKMNNLSHTMAPITAIAGAIYGWNKPEQKYLQAQNKELQIENTQLQIKSDAGDQAITHIKEIVAGKSIDKQPDSFSARREQEKLAEAGASQGKA